MNINSIRMKDKLIKDAWAVLLEEIQIANPALPPLLNRGLPRNFVESEIQKFSVLLPEDLLIRFR